MSNADLMLRAWVTGFVAQREGHALSACPHAQDEAAHWRWRLGWKAAATRFGEAGVEVIRAQGELGVYPLAKLLSTSVDKSA